MTLVVHGGEYGGANLVGHNICGQCHESELSIWLGSPHANIAHVMIDEHNRRFNPKTKKILGNLPDGNLASRRKCMKCHDTRNSKNGHIVSLRGISCESCHGAAGAQGGAKGWLDMHHELEGPDCDPNGDLKKREMQRVAFLEEKGMRHPKNIYGIIKACIECHTVSDEDVVSAGHPTGRIGFEYLSWFRDDLRHPSELTNHDFSERNRNHQACLKFLVGQLVDLEVSLRNRAHAKTHGYAISAATRIAASQDTLLRIQKVAPLPEIASALVEVSGVYPMLFTSDTTGHGLFEQSASKISRMANGFAAKYEEGSLAGIESFLPSSHPVYKQTTGLISVDDQPAFAQRNAWPAPDPSKVKGHAVCVQCHQSEYDAWSRSAHAREAFDELRTNPNSFTYARRLGIDANDIATRSVCVTCHATQRLEHDGTPGVLAGISCESCHNAAGGTDGWLNAHSFYGIAGTRRAHESTAHRTRRLEKLRRAGMNRSRDIYELAKNCYRCHVVSNERVVAQGGHKVGRFDFEWVEWSQGEVRHNFHLDQHKNAVAPTLWTVVHPKNKQAPTAAERKFVMFVVGQLVDIEVSLRNRATAVSPEFSRVAAGRIAAACARLSQLQDAVSSLAMADLLSDIDELKPRLFSPPTEALKSQFEALADRVAQSAKSFAANCDPSSLEKVDVFVPKSGNGKVYRP